MDDRVSRWARYCTWRSLRADSVRQGRPWGTVLRLLLLPSSKSPCQTCQWVSPQFEALRSMSRRPFVCGLGGIFLLGFGGRHHEDGTARIDHRAGAYRWCGALSTRAPSALVVSFDKINHRACMRSTPSAWSASRSQGGARASDGSRGRAPHRAAYAISSRPGAAEASPHPESPTGGI